MCLFQVNYLSGVCVEMWARESLLCGKENLASAGITYSWSLKRARKKKEGTKVGWLAAPSPCWLTAGQEVYISI